MDNKIFLTIKSPGLDGIFAGELQSAADILFLWVPIGGNYHYVVQAKVIFIPKDGRSRHCNPISFRPIILTYFLLKILERML